MLLAGEAAGFVARRIVICASEDVGNADPRALMLDNVAFQATEYLGMTEARIPLAQATVYIACAPKSNASYLAIDKAMKDVSENKTLGVPAHLKDASYKGAQQLGHGEGYKYAHDYEGHFVAQEYLEKKIQYYFPTDQGYEKNMKQALKRP